MDYLVFIGKISICFILGIIIGLERQHRGRVAGIRTITLVALGSFLFVTISDLTANNDVTRIAAQVVSGIGFLGAGVILKDGTNIKGLNTAATLWCSAAVGTLTALGLIIEAIIGVLFILLTNVILRIISKRMMKKMPGNKVSRYFLSIVCSEEKELIIKNMLLQKLKNLQVVINNFSTTKSEDQIKVEAHLDIEVNSFDNVENIINRLCLEPGVNSLDFNKVSNYSAADGDEDNDYEVQ